MSSASSLRTGRVWDLVGNTPLIRLESLSKLTGCKIYGKAEYLNPGGSVKDRAAKEVAEILPEDVPGEFWDGLKANLYAAGANSKRLVANWRQGPDSIK